MLQKKNIPAGAVSKVFSFGECLQPQIKTTGLRHKTPQAIASPSTLQMLEVAHTCISCSTNFR